MAIDRTSPNGRVVGIDIIPAQPPKGVSTIQGNFLSETVREEVKKFLRDPERGRPRPGPQSLLNSPAQGVALRIEELEESKRDYVDLERRADLLTPTDDHMGRKDTGDQRARVVNVVLSDMSAPWEQTTGFWKRSLSNPHFRMMNTSGMNFRDHAGSMVSKSSASTAHHVQLVPVGFM